MKLENIQISENKRCARSSGWSTSQNRRMYTRCDRSFRFQYAGKHILTFHCLSRIQTKSQGILTVYLPRCSDIILSI